MRVWGHGCDLKDDPEFIDDSEFEDEAEERMSVSDAEDKASSDP